MEKNHLNIWKLIKNRKRDVDEITQIDMCTTAEKTECLASLFDPTQTNQAPGHTSNSPEEHFKENARAIILHI